MPKRIDLPHRSRSQHLVTVNPPLPEYPNAIRMNTEDENWLSERNRLTDCLFESPYHVIHYLDRATAYKRLAYNDLAAADAYRALLLIDEALDESGEYHEQAEDTLKLYIEDQQLPVALEGLIEEKTRQAYALLVQTLTQCGCLKSALDFYNRAVNTFPHTDARVSDRLAENLLKKARAALPDLYGEASSLKDIDIKSLPDSGSARREIYPWNSHEPDRFSEASLAFLNAEMARVAPKCEVRVTELPLLREHDTPDEEAVTTTTRQLGVFAIKDIQPGEAFFSEPSVLTATNRLHDSLCDACNTAFDPASPAAADIVSCPSCDDIFFCNASCLARAQATYHPAVCGIPELDTLGRDAPPAEAASALYMLLTGRALAMAVTTATHPLELPSVKYLWGDFSPSPSASTLTLPFSFGYDVLAPLHVLTTMGRDVYGELGLGEPWVLATLAAKFRGVASARLAERAPFGPAVCAVHPLWCLANHACDPNAAWAWAGEMRLWARAERVGGGGDGGVRRGEQVWSHYCDVGLGVRERRAWMWGTLGGGCACERCTREEAELREREREREREDGNEGHEDVENRRMIG